MTVAPVPGLSLAPFRALRPVANGAALGRLLCPPYDVIDDLERARLLASDPENAVSVVLPRAESGEDPYRGAARRLDRWVRDDQLRADDEPALYVYEMHPGDGPATRGLLGAVELRDPADGVILPHEDTMAGPVADRLALMTATDANLEPIYLVYDGGGVASDLVGNIDADPPLAETITPDGTTHRLWALTDSDAHRAIAGDLQNRRALIADGHHRYATYRELQRTKRAAQGPGPWDRGLTLLVDSSTYGPQVHAIHRILVGLPLQVAVDRAGPVASIAARTDLDTAINRLGEEQTFAVVLTDGAEAYVLTDPERRLRSASVRAGEPDVLAELDVTILHRALVGQTWDLPDTADSVGYAHSVAEAIAGAGRSGGTAVLLRPTPVAAVAAVAAAGARMPRKSTLFTPKPASGLVMRRFADG